MKIPIVTHSLKYNPALDGLRGIAILLVLFFHLFPNYFSFGYIGVDIFFLLSGFLITQIIYTKLEKNSFSFLEFYRNRIRRIFPALIIVLIFTLIIGYLFLFPSELADLGKHLKSSAFFYQNFQLMHEVGYWDKAAELKPLLHCWSLSIEEQFYLLWPLTILLIYKSRVDLLIALLIVVFLLMVSPFLFNIDTFYHSVSRFWELAFGGLTYALTRSCFYKYFNLRSWVVVLLFVAALIYVYGNSSYSFLKTFVVVLTTALAILYVTKNSHDKFFASKFLVFFGLISYPLYLWHYVIISYQHIFGFNVQKYAVATIVLSILFSFLTYRYIEIYARRSKSYLFATILFVILLSIGFLGNYIYKERGLPSRSFLIDNRKFQKQFIRTPAKNALGFNLVSKVLGYRPSNDYIKATSDDLHREYVVIVGDSHAHTSYPGFAQMFKKRGLETLLIANSSCPPYVGGAMGSTLNKIRECQKKINDIYKTINKIPHIKKLIFATRGPTYIYGIGYGVVDGGNEVPYSGSKFIEYFVDRKLWNQKRQFFNKIERTFQYFSSKKFKTYYLIEDPELGFLPKNCMERPFGILPSQCRISYSDYIHRAGEYRERVYQIGKKYPVITILDPKWLYCDHEYCYAVKDGKMLYADDDHHSIDGSIMQAKFFKDKLLHD